MPKRDFSAASKFRPQSEVANFWKGRHACPDCGHAAYLFGCECEAEYCRCRKRRVSSDT